MVINQLLTPYNYNSGNTSRIKYIVIHYVGALGGAKANCQWYAGGYRGASAHYYVGFDGEYWQSVRDQDIAWAVGASNYVHPNCRNSNSLSIEMCVRNNGSQSASSKSWYFEDATVKATIELTKYLMKKYNVPASNVIRHYDVTGKICPNPYVYNHTKYTWSAFKSALTGGSSSVVDPTPTETFKATGIATCTGQDVRVRTSPNGPVIGYLGKGNSFEIDGKISGSWTHVKVNGIGIGWVSSQYVKISGSSNSGNNANTATVYYVKAGDSLSKIAKSFGVSVDALAKANNISNPNVIFVGQKIVAPKSNNSSSSSNSGSSSNNSNPLIRGGQIHANNFAGAGLTPDGFRGPKTVQGVIKCLQTALNLDYKFKLKVDGSAGPATKEALGDHYVTLGETQYLATFVQIALMCKGYDPKGVECPGNVGNGCYSAIKQYQKDHGLTVDGSAGRVTILSLIS